MTVTRPLDLHITAYAKRHMSLTADTRLLILDEVGFLPLDAAEASLLFEVVSRRYERGSIVATSNKAFSEWGQVLGDEVLAPAILDRLLHHCDVASINGPSYRLKDHVTPKGGDASV